MTLHEFNILSFEDKCRNTIDNGISLYTYVTKVEVYECYSFEDFFVEAVYDNNNAVIEFRSYRTGEKVNSFSGVIEF